jgi:streptogramin lyase
MKGTLIAAATLLAITLTGCNRAPPRDEAPAAPAGLAGRVVDAAGQGVGGMMVTARDARGIETTVFTAKDGAFGIDRLGDGAYTVTARGAGRRVAPVQVVVAGGTGSAAALRAVDDAEFLQSLPSARFLALLPDGDMKQEFILNCGTCHEINHKKIFKDGAPRDAAKWLEAIKMMRALDVYKVIPPDFDDARYAAWLAEGLTPQRIATLQPEPAFDAALAGRVRITEYPLPKPDELPHDLVYGPDGRVWVTAFWHSQMWALNPADGAIESFPVSSTPDVAAQVRALEFDRDGILWIINGGTKSVVRLDPQTRKFDEFPVGMYAHDIDLDSKGNVWFNDYFAERERIGTLDRTSGKVSYFDLPSAKLDPKAGIPLPYGMQIDAKDRLWSTQLAANTLAMYEIPTGRTALYEMPNPNSGPRRTAIGADGSLWIPEFNTGRLARFDPATENFTVYDTGNRGLGNYDVEFDPKSGAVWMTGSLNSSMLRFEPGAGTFEEIRLPTEPAYVRHVAVDGASGDVWIAYSSLPTAVPKVARIERR